MPKWAVISFSTLSDSFSLFQLLSLYENIPKSYRIIILYVRELMKPNSLVYLLFFPFFFPFLLTAQLGNVDSLIQTLDDLPADERKVLLYDSIANYYLIHQLDSTPIFARKGLALAEEIAYDKGRIESYNILGNYHERQTRYDSALVYYDKALKICRATNSISGLAIVLNNLAIVYTRQGRYQEAMSLYFEALDAEEKQGNEKGVAETYNNIGVVYYYLQDMDKTIEYLQKSLEIEERLGDKSILLKGYNNIGALYDYQKDFDKALVYFQKSYALAKEIDDKAELSISLNNIALVHYEKQDFETAALFQAKALALKKDLGDYRGAAYSYHSFASLEQARGNIAKAEEFYLKSLEIAAANQLVRVQSETYKNLSVLFQDKGNYEKALTYLQQHLSLRDSVLSKERTRAITEMETKYRTKQKENKILAQRAEIAEQKWSIAQERRQALFIGAVAIVLLLLALLLITRQRASNKQLKQAQALQAANAKIELQAHLEAQRLSVSRDLHDNIASQLTFIISSLDNLKYQFKLQEEALLKKLSQISNFTKNTTYELRDTIWAMNKGFIRFEDMQERMQSYIQKAQELTTGIAFDFEIAGAIESDTSFSAIKGMNIYRILQEAIHNALKYAAPNRIAILVEKNGADFVLHIQDDGKGFDPSRIEAGNGLYNMQKRAQNIQAQFDLQTAPGEGCHIRLRFASHQELSKAAWLSDSSILALNYYAPYCSYCRW